jgi:alpha-1,3-mannosyltransferase
MKLSLRNIGHVWLLIEFCIVANTIFFDDTYIFDWDAYMEQAYQVYQLKEYNYSKLMGDTGPLVYPAGHVWIHTACLQLSQWNVSHWTSVKDQKVDLEFPEKYLDRNIYKLDVIKQLQWCFAIVWMMICYFALSLVQTVSLHQLNMHGNKRKIKSISDNLSISECIPFMFTLILMSIHRRSRNVVITGFFNDSWAMLFGYLSLYLSTLLEEHDFSSVKWYSFLLSLSIGISIKMNILLLAPGVAMIMVSSLLSKKLTVRNALVWFYHVITSVSFMIVVQVVIALPFLMHDSTSYLSRAFQFDRKFTQVWSINWFWIDTSVFSSTIFAKSLLALHLPCLALYFYFQAKDCSTKSPIKSMEMLIASNVIGILFSRSLHYQFHLWYWHMIPIVFLIRRDTGDFMSSITMYIIDLVFILLFERSWGVQPPTFDSSLSVTLHHAYLLYVILHDLTREKYKTLKTN